MEQLVSCPDCGASNAPDAKWCNQCYTSFTLPRAGSESPETARPPQPATGWSCVICEGVNSPHSSECETCGTSIFASFKTEPEKADPLTALRSSVVPGLGLVRVGMSLEGVLTAVLVTFAIGTGFSIVVAGSAGGYVLLLVGIMAWLVAARDSYVVASGSPSDAWLQGRTISLMAAVMVLIAAILILRVPIRPGE